jgi:hypothetical protein
MNKIASAAAILALAVQPAFAQPTQSNVATLAQALDRCMATYAVRLTKTGMADEAIYRAAADGCKQIEADLTAAVRRDIPAAQGNAALAQWKEQAKPNFVALLQRIRADRAAQGAMSRAPNP